MKQLPPNAEKKFEGIIYDVYQWEQEQFDGSLKTFECIKRLDLVIIIALFDDKIFLMDEQQPGRESFWSLPAGRFDKDETDSLLVAKRELIEEVGAISDDWKLINVYEKGGTTMVGNTYIYVARDCKIIQEPSLDIGGEIIHETKNVSFDEFLSMYKESVLEGGALESTTLRALLDEKKYNDFKNLIYG